MCEKISSDLVCIRISKYAIFHYKLSSSNFLTLLKENIYLFHAVQPRQLI